MTNDETSDQIVYSLMNYIYNALDEKKYKTSRRDKDSLVALVCDQNPSVIVCQGCKYYKNRGCLLSKLRVNEY